MVGCSSRKSAATVNDIKVQSVSSQSLEAMILASQKPYHLVNFYATYCKPCIKEIPELIALKNAENGEIEVSFVSLDDEDVVKTQLNTFLEEHQMDFNSYTFQQDSAEKYILQHFPDWDKQIPLTLIFDKSGRFVSHIGMTDKAEIELIVTEDKNLR